MIRRGSWHGLLCVCLLSAACTSTPDQAAVSASPPPPSPVPTSLGVPSGSQALGAQRLLIRQVALTLEADNPGTLDAPITQIATEAGGFVERASTTEAGGWT